MDTHDAVVVAAESEDEARKISPTGDIFPEGSWAPDRKALSTWCSKPEQVTVELIGMAAPFTKAGVVLASFESGG